MPSTVPLNNALAQSSVDFNNQTLTNPAGLFRYKVNTYTTKTHVFTTADLNAVCKFSGDVTVIISSAYVGSPVPGTEIIVYSVGGFVKVVFSVDVTFNYSDGVFTDVNKPGKLVYAGNDKWFFASANRNSNGYGWTNCCNEGSDIFQLSDNFTPSVRVYVDSGLTIPFNGLFQYEDEVSTFYYIVDGDVQPGSFECSTNSYTTAYTFYTGPDPISDAVTFYSVAGLTENSYNNLLGNKFFTSNVGEQFDCYTTDQVASGTQTTFYGDTDQYPNHYIIIQDGYVINYT
jgi:hypothetical protein